MSSEAITTAMFLIAAVISAGVLINAVFPVIYSLSGTISSSSHAVDERLSTDIRIVTTYASGNSNTARIWLKNIGTGRIATTEIEKADVFLGAEGDFIRLSHSTTLSEGTWRYEILEDTNGQWDPGETLYIEGMTSKIPSSGDVVYFQFVLPSGIYRSTTFTAGD
ncbi:flagellin [Methanoculleus sp.]|uniref:flagellin n=1 Tax=Methanoculleus sp. TaxID=90427 RepID=UPI002624BAF9|nr:flagellin [Methanoculleus sp.]MDI6867894.1 flagellin [Methanoculleus sp.]